MKKFIFFVSMVLASSLFFTGCGPFDNNGSGNGNRPIVVPPVVTDTTAPVITVLGDNPATVLLNETYTDAGATATDDVDGTVDVTTSGTVDTSTVGSYTITYTATDAAGNVATETRTVNVVENVDPNADITAPVITLKGQNPQTIVVGAYTELGARAVDNVDGIIPVEIDVSGLNENLVGTYIVAYSATDSSGNTATAIRTVNVIADATADDTPPVITLLGANPQIIYLDGIYVELGATALDDLDGDITTNIEINATGVDTSVEGNYTVTYNVKDANGNAAAEAVRDVYVRVVVLPPSPTADITSQKLACDVNDTTSSTDAVDFNASQTEKRNISSTSLEDANREMPTNNITPKRLSAVVPATNPDGTLVDDGATLVHPLLVSYVQQIVGDYEMGEGSANVGDPTHLDGVFVGISMDNGDTWKNFTISDTTDKWSKQVVWNNATINYPGHAQKPTMAVEGNNILVAWNDKYCPSGNPFDLVQDSEGNYTTDYFAVNGAQGSIDYEGIVALPNGKTVYEVPFSCVWTARGLFDPADGTITWTSPMQLTSGTRDSNHIKVASSSAGFALAWQEDTVGLKSGKGEGPGDGWSGATTGHGTDIWYTSIKMEDFNDLNVTDENTSRPKSLYNFHYPVRITDNEKCQVGDSKPYCNYMCDTYGSVDTNQSNNSGSAISRCMTYDIDMLTDTPVVLDGDTGASRAALNILKNVDGQHVVVFGYEETKGLSESTPGDGSQDQGDSTTIIELEGKSVYFESFLFDAIDAVNLSTDFKTIMETAKIPMVSAGNIVNVRVPDRNDTSKMIYENARRLVIGTQTDSCDAERFTFAFLYKQSFDTQGASSDMFVRVNNGLTYESFTYLDDYLVPNVSAQVPQPDVTAADYNVSWSAANLDDNTYDNDIENTFSPRIFLRGNDIFVGYAYTPLEKEGHMPSNFHIHRYVNGSGWQGPQNITKITRADRSAVDPRFFTTPKGIDNGLALDQSNPDIMFVTWGTIEDTDLSDPVSDRREADLFYVRSTNRGVDWDANESMLSAREGTVVEEKAVESFTNPDGKTIYNVWLQDVEHDVYLTDPTNPFYGVDTWFGHVDYNISTVTPQ